MLKDKIGDIETIELYVDLEAKAERIDCRTHTELRRFLEELVDDIEEAIQK